jgi:hypothetical protein
MKNKKKLSLISKWNKTGLLTNMPKPKHSKCADELEAMAYLLYNTKTSIVPMPFLASTLLPIITIINREDILKHHINIPELYADYNKFLRKKTITIKTLYSVPDMEKHIVDTYIKKLKTR